MNQPAPIDYPRGPAAVPPNYAAPSRQYKRHAWLAMAALCLFVALYLALAGWFVFKAWRLVEAGMGGGRDNVFLFLVALLPAFLAVFMIKALFFVKAGGSSDELEVTREKQPRLFAFLDRIADEAGAPRAHRVFLSAQVNACVFYDLSVLNLIVPSKKNLEIGLGLVNVLDLGQLKAVLAHEFGHFAQRSMAVGRWVYVAQQIAQHIVAKRDGMDKFLVGLSSVDIRIAWIGWLLRLIVWSIRSLLEQVFRGVLLAQRALSREMEFQADLVAVSMTGSDALIQALHRIQGADEAWDQAIGFANREWQKGHRTVDLFAVQARALEHLGRLYGDASFGRTPAAHGKDARVFSAALASPPRMWLTHPLNHEREDNAKRQYLSAEGDGRSAWALFDDPDGLRREISAKLAPGDSATPRDPAETLAALDEEFAVESLRGHYRGAYLGRSPVRDSADVDALIDGSCSGRRAELDALYPESLSGDLEQARTLAGELNQLEGIRNGRLDATGGVVRHRGRAFRRRELPQVIAGVKQESDELAARLGAHDRRCRGTHHAIAKRLGRGWPEYHRGLIAQLHYADHQIANLRDAQRMVGNVYAVVTADGKVSQAEIERLLKAAAELQRPLEAVYTHPPMLRPDAGVLGRLGVEHFGALWQEFKLGTPVQANLSSWLENVDGWVNFACRMLQRLRSAALEELLETEKKLAGVERDGSDPGDAPAPAELPSDYPRLLPGQERPLQTTLGWWDRFQTADGWLPGAARLAVAGSIVAAVVGFGGSIESARLYLHNGLGRGVVVSVGAETVQVAAGATEHLDLAAAPVHVATRTLDGTEIESFDAKIGTAMSHVVYNVASGSALVEWTASYGPASPVPQRNLGAPRWIESSADHLFEEPPRTISTRHGEGGTRRVLAAADETVPGVAMEFVSNPAEQKAMQRAHARFDPPGSPNLLDWLAMGDDDPGFTDILKARLAADPHEVAALRAEQDKATDEGRAAVCERHAKLAAAAPDDSAMAYIALRCADLDGSVRDGFLAAAKRWPKDPWLAYAAGLDEAGHAHWAEAERLLEVPAHGTQLSRRAASFLIRVHRAGGGGERADLATLRKDATDVDFLLDAEKDYAPLAKGDIDTFLAAPDLNPHQKARRLRLAAASRPDDDKLVGQALNLKDDLGVDRSVLGAAAGLAIRRALSVEAVDALSSKHMSRKERQHWQAFVAALRKGDRIAVEQAVDGMFPDLRGQAYVAALVSGVPGIPADWRQQVERLTFVAERPYFAAAK